MSSLYIHLPFCKKKCSYCDFVSYAGKEELIDEYVDVLIKEIKSSPHFFLPKASTNKPLSIKNGEGHASTSKMMDTAGVRCVYFGGGTPTLLEAKHFEKIFTALTPLYSFRSLIPSAPLPMGEGNVSTNKMMDEIGVREIEISIESNPGTADLAKIKALRELGINRLSIGVQSFNDRHLQTLGRIHNSKEVFKFYEDARAAGFKNINLDLIFALPNQTFEEWQKDLQAAIALNPEHLSTYNLQIEENTPLWKKTKSEILNPKQSQNSKFQIPNEETELKMYEYTIETLTTKGYKHYEISAFAKPGFECRHNINYWKNGSYIGIGAGAHSHVNGRRWANPSSIEEYLNKDALPKTPDDSPDLPAGQAGATNQRETLFLGLRLLEGLSIDHFNGFEKEVGELIKDGLLTREKNNYKLTRQGLYLANRVFEKFV